MIGFRRIQQTRSGKVNVREFNVRNKKFGKKLVLAFGRDFKKNAKDGAPVDKGKLKKSIGDPTKEGIWEFSEKKFSLNVGTQVSYAMAVERGFRAKTVTTDDLFVFKNPQGNMVYAKKIKLPARRGKWFLKKAATKTKRNSGRIIRSVIRKV